MVKTYCWGKRGQCALCSEIYSILAGIRTHTITSLFSSFSSHLMVTFTLNANVKQKLVFTESIAQINEMYVKLTFGYDLSTGNEATNS